MDLLGSQRAAWDSTLPGIERLILLALLDHMPTCRPSIARLEKRTGFNRTTVLRALAVLAGAGIITICKTHGRRSEYHLTDDWVGAAAAFKPVALRDQSRSATSRSPRPQPVALRDHNQSLSATTTSRSPRPKVTNQVTNQVTPIPPRGPKTSKAKATADGDPKIAEVIAHYHSTFLATFGRKPVADYPRAAKAIQSALTAVDAETLKRAITIQLTQRRLDQFARGRDALKLPDIIRLVDEILAWSPAPAPAKPRLAAVPAEPPTQTYNVRKLPGR